MSRATEVIDLAAVFGTLITVRTLKQGISIVQGKRHPEYEEAVGVLEIGPEDMRRLGIRPGERVRVRSSFGEVVVVCKEAELPSGLFCLPMGPVANSLVGPDTNASGMPPFKGTAVSLEPWRGE